ncbi:hypothetical protein R4J00_02700 [Brachyspira intermedia]|uniref:hypothetical protein n=1 Tax=Brachyspira intermedia TaxID=84377 RepID=UPI003006CD48
MICCICGLRKKETDNALIPCKITMKVKDKKCKTRYRKVLKNICRKCLSKAFFRAIPIIIDFEEEDDEE